MAKTTLGDLEGRSFWCVTEFAKQSLVGAAVGLLVSVVAFKQHAPLGIYGAGLGGGYAAFSCSRSFEEHKHSAPLPPVLTSPEPQLKTTPMTAEQEQLLESLQMLTVIQDKSH